MKSTLNFLVGICVLIPLANYGQQTIKPNEFKIGMFGAPGRLIDNPNGGAKVPYATKTDGGGYKTSTLNVYKEDGFNVWQANLPGIWDSKEGMENLINLSIDNGLEILLSANNFYKPINASTGENTYNNCGVLPALLPYQAPYLFNYARPDYDDLFNTVFSQPTYKDWIWGYHISEEGSYLHPHHKQSNCTGLSSSDYLNVEVPPSRVVEAMNHFKSLLVAQGINNHKMEIMPANHNRSINNNTIDLESPNFFNAKEYITLLNKNDTRDVMFEGSYTAPPQVNWYQEVYSDIQQATGWHRLGFLKTIDYAKEYTSEIHKVINIENMPWAPRLIHTDSSFSKNGNLMWFQAYTSIIHGAKGIWFFDYDQSYSDCDRVNVLISNGKTMADIITKARSYYPTDPILTIMADNQIICTSTAPISEVGVTVGDLVAKAAFDLMYEIPNCFDREYFSPIYTKYVSHLVKELSYLVKKDIVSTDPSTIIYTKTDGPDANCIVPPAQNYIQPAINSAGLSGYATELCTENYGLRYTIRTNGLETYMIISNPLNLTVTNVALDFSTVANPIIKNSTGVAVLFNDGVALVTDASYKVDRESTINLSNLTVGVQYPLSYTGNKQLTLSFGPYDVKILKFVSNPPNHNNGWDLAWSNFGSGNIGGHVLGEDDLYYTGDFNGDGEEELLCVGQGPNTDWITLLKYQDGNWSWLWSNYGNPAAGNGIYNYRNNLKVGDFDNDNKDDVIGIIYGSTNYVSFFEFTGADWNLKWTSSKHSLKDYSDKIYVGNFDNYDGKDELFGVKSDGTSNMFKWSGTTFTSIWSSTSNHAINPYVSTMFSGDFDAGGKDLLLGFSSSWSVLFNFYSGDWHWTWGNNGNAAIGGIPLPFLSTDRILAGNLDGDPKDEFFYIQTHDNASWAISHDLVANPNWDWSWNWSANPTPPAVSFIDDWPLASNVASITKYFLIKAVANESSYLLAMRKFDGYNSCDNFIVNMYKPNVSTNFKLTNGDLAMDINNSEPVNNFKLYPNPSTGKILIESKNGTISTIEIYDIRGQLIFKNSYGLENNIQIDISDKPNGIYFIKIISSNNTDVKKIIKN